MSMRAQRQRRAAGRPLLSCTPGFALRPESWHRPPATRTANASSPPTPHLLTLPPSTRRACPRARRGRRGARSKAAQRVCEGIASPAPSCTPERHPIPSPEKDPRGSGTHASTRPARAYDGWAYDAYPVLSPPADEPYRRVAPPAAPASAGQPRECPNCLSAHVLNAFETPLRSPFACTSAGAAQRCLQRLQTGWSWMAF
eukprot:351841-Chlamydomonas_euryale.AAC.14